ncbi:hypothetical protein EIN_523780 [Entamoeba invadens IP1]|uniref:Rab-GAP TBC domain-containing protein n=1 Tax=Entamoeba invadens IP1 TaxID=370355 RepID=A0A0A1UEW8_ENTIV|nr:hypothetical protein EIN_523780 [Entamoeba invadens IP1]ELP92480.1 hypothetical protein EIN_523780 [Entamoeba invadens IP1]|eukprot:XP_004259251.1 hypothetical protein EIN_523780 [Entamoeba invadens IP1]
MQVKTPRPVAPFRKQQETIRQQHSAPPSLPKRSQQLVEQQISDPQCDKLSRSENYEKTDTTESFEKLEKKPRALPSLPAKVNTDKLSKLITKGFKEQQERFDKTSPKTPERQENVKIDKQDETQPIKNPTNPKIALKLPETPENLPKSEKQEKLEKVLSQGFCDKNVSKPEKKSTKSQLPETQEKLEKILSQSLCDKNSTENYEKKNNSNYCGKIVLKTEKNMTKQEKPKVVRDSSFPFLDFTIKREKDPEKYRQSVYSRENTIVYTAQNVKIIPSNHFIVEGDFFVVLKSEHFFLRFSPNLIKPTFDSVLNFFKKAEIPEIDLDEYKMVCCLTEISKILRGKDAQQKHDFVTLVPARVLPFVIPKYFFLSQDVDRLVDLIKEIIFVKTENDELVLTTSFLPKHFNEKQTETFQYMAKVNADERTLKRRNQWKQKRFETAKKEIAKKNPVLEKDEKIQKNFFDEMKRAGLFENEPSVTSDMPKIFQTNDEIVLGKILAKIREIEIGGKKEIIEPEYNQNLENVDRSAQSMDEMVRTRLVLFGSSNEARWESWKFCFGLSNSPVSISKMTEEYTQLNLIISLILPVQLSNWSVLSTTIDQIDKDLKRVDYTSLTKIWGQDAKPVLRRLLLAYSIYNYNIGYVQGEHDIVIGLMEIGRNEVEIFYVFSKVMEMVEREFECPKSAEFDRRLMPIISYLDDELGKYLHDKNISMYFVYQWLALLFKRDFGGEIYELWDAIFAYPKHKLQYFITAIIIEEQREHILGNLLGFDEMSMFFQCLSGLFKVDVKIEADQLYYNFIENAPKEEVQKVFC